MSDNQSVGQQYIENKNGTLKGSEIDLALDSEIKEIERELDNEVYQSSKEEREFLGDVKRMIRTF